MSHRVRHHLGVEIHAYDDAIRRFIPGYDTMLRVAAEEVATVRPAQVLDLGAGTGALSRAILERADADGLKTKVALIDVDEEMIGQARGRLASFADRTSFRRQSYHDALPACDAAASSLALHHVPEIGEKRRLYERIFAVLRPGGVFVNADAVVPVEPRERDATYEAWAAHMVAGGISRERAFEHFAEWAKEDTYQSLSDELAAVAAAGFEATCPWRAGPVSVVVGRKPRCVQTART